MGNHLKPMSPMAWYREVGKPTIEAAYNMQVTPVNNVVLSRPAEITQHRTSTEIPTDPAKPSSEGSDLIKAFLNPPREGVKGFLP